MMIELILILLNFSRPKKKINKSTVLCGRGHALRRERIKKIAEFLAGGGQENFMFHLHFSRRLGQGALSRGIIPAFENLPQSIRHVLVAGRFVVRNGEVQGNLGNPEKLHASGQAALKTVLARAGASR